MGHGAMRGPTPLNRCATPSLGISPTPEVDGGWHPSLAYIRRGRGALLFIIYFEISSHLSLPLFSFLEWTPLVWSLHLVGDFSTIRTSSCCYNRDPNPSSFRCSTGSEPGGTSGILYVYNPARHYTCGATSSSWLYHGVFTDSVLMGKQSRHRSQGPGGYSSHRGAVRHRGFPVRLHQPRSRGNISRLTDYIPVCDLFHPLITSDRKSVV